MNQSTLFSTKKKLSVLFAILVFLIVSFLGVLFFSGKFFNFSSQEKKEFQQITTLFIFEYRKNPEFIKNIFLQERKVGNNLIERPIRPQRGEKDVLRFLNVFIINRQGEIIFQNVGQELEGEINLEKLYFKKGLFTDNGNLVETQTLQRTGETFIFIKKKGYDLEDFLQELVEFLLLTGLLGVGFYFIGLYFSGKILKPVEQNIADMNHFIHNAGHELKTPLAVTSTNLQLLSQLKTYEPDLIQSSISEIQRMDQLIVGLSQLSDIQTFSHQEKIHLKDSIEHVIGEYQTKIQEKELTLTQNIEDISFFGNKAYFDILFGNLLSNAIKYNTKKGSISITVNKKYLIIENTGNIITDEQKEKIFERFYRIETARNSEGFGIGLSLVKKICDIFSWKIRVKNTLTTNIFEIEL